MRTSFSRYYLLLLVGFVALILSSCAGLTAIDPPSVGTKVTPDTTDPSTLILTLAIDDDENATDGKVGITMVISTDEISEQNHIQFLHGEKMFCNGVQLIFNDPVYTARVLRPDQLFRCEYVRNGRAYSISEPARPLLKPVLSHDSKFVLSYTPESRGLSPCQMQVDTSDANSANAPDKFTEGPSGSHQVNQGSLSGVGSLILIRTCGTRLKGIQTPSDTVNPRAATPFDRIDITYTSTYRLYETWEPPA